MSEIHADYLRSQAHAEIDGAIRTIEALPAELLAIKEGRRSASTFRVAGLLDATIAVTRAIATLRTLDITGTPAEPQPPSEPEAALPVIEDTP